MSGSFAHRHHVPHVLVHEKLADPALFIDVCHFTPEGIERLAIALEEGMRTLKQDGMEKCLSGMTGIKEVRSVCIK